MSTTTMRRRAGSATAVAAALTMVLALAAPVGAAEPAWQMDLPAGLACADFGIHVDGFGSGPEAVRTFEGRGGLVVDLQAGTGYAMTFTNAETGASYSTSASGAVSRTTSFPDASQTMALAGHNVVILFPADGGPSTTLYVGRVTIDVATDGVWTVQQRSGVAFDLCAAIS